MTEHTIQPTTNNKLTYTLLIRYLRHDGRVLTRYYDMTWDLNHRAENDFEKQSVVAMGYAWIETLEYILAINLEHLLSINFLQDLGEWVDEGNEHIVCPIQFDFDCDGVTPESDDKNWFGLFEGSADEALDIALALEFLPFISLIDNDAERLFFGSQRVAIMAIDKTLITRNGTPIALALANHFGMEIGSYMPDLSAMDEEEDAEIHFDDLVVSEPRLAALRDEVAGIRDNLSRSYFCANEIWFAPGGPKRKLTRLVGLWAEKNDSFLHSRDAYDTAYQTLYDLLPPCRNCWCS